MEAQDAVKLIFQAEMGCGHLLADEGIVAQRIEAEEAALTPSADEPLTEPLGPRYIRLNLRRAMTEGLQPQWIARLMRLTDAHPDIEQAIKSLREAAHLDNSAWAEAFIRAAERLATEPDWLPNHSPAYHAAYAPAYRVIPRAAERLLPILRDLAKKWDKPRLLVAIDGPCGSGKTTLAAQLRAMLDAAIVPMDDFFLPHAKKTAERLSQPGGNADHERFVEEFLLPWMKDGQASYRPYDCHADAFSAPVSVPVRKVTIIEGSYSLLPEIGNHADVRAFLLIDTEEQQRRILTRNGEAMLQRFIERWIPLEQAYFAAYALPDEHCLVVDGHVQSV